MRRRAIPLLTCCALVVTLLAAADPAKRPAEEGPPPREVPVANPGPDAPGPKPVPSRVVGVTVYPTGALVTREVEVPEGMGTLELAVSPLPPATVNSSLYSEGTDGIRVLTTRLRTRPVAQDTRADVRKLQDELRRLHLERDKVEAESKAIQANSQSLGKLEGFMGVTTVQATEKGALNADAAIALGKHVRETRLELARELVGLQQQLQANQEKAEFAQRQLSELSSGTVRTERDAVVVVEKANAAAGKVRLNYLVDAASWQPQYKMRAGKTTRDAVNLEYLAAVVQHTGEDWGSVHLVLSTAQPMLNAVPPDLQTLNVTVVPRAATPAVQVNAEEVEEQSKNLRGKAQKSLNEKKQASGVGMVNTAAALDQSWELFNPEAAMKRGCVLGPREGPSVTYHLSTRLSVPSRSDEQILEIARFDLAPDYYYKAVPIITQHVYRMAELTNKSNHVLLPGDLTAYVGTDFVGQMSMPLVAIGETFTVGFGVDPQLQVRRQMTDRAKTTQGANQLLRYTYRIQVDSYKSERVRMQVWDRLPHAEGEQVSVSLVKATPDLSLESVYVREQRPNNLLRWDVTLDPGASGEKALAIGYEFKMELDRQMAISSFQTAGVLASAAAANPAAAAVPAPTGPEEARIRAAMAKLSPEERALAEAQVFCAVDQESRLGSMGPILKVMIKGTPVFLCCKGCEAEARIHPDETLDQCRKLIARMAAAKK